MAICLVAPRVYVVLNTSHDMRKRMVSDVNEMDIEREICGNWWPLLFVSSAEESFDVFDKVIIKVTH